MKLLDAKYKTINELQAKVDELQATNKKLQATIEKLQATIEVQKKELEKVKTRSETGGYIKIVVERLTADVQRIETTAADTQKILRSLLR